MPDLQVLDPVAATHHVGVVAASTLLAYAHSILPLVLPVYCDAVILGKVYACVTVVCGFDDAAADAAAVVLAAADVAAAAALIVRVSKPLFFWAVSELVLQART